MTIILTPKNLLRSEDVIKSKLEMNDFYLPRDMFDLAKEVFYINGGNRQIIKWEGRTGLTSEQFQKLLMGRVLSGMTYAAANSLLNSVKEKLDDISVVRQD